MLAGQGGRECGQHLRRDERGEDALQDPGADQRRYRWRQPAQQGHDREAQQADGEYPAPAEGVAEATTENQEHGVGSAVAGDDEFQRSRRSMQVVIDGRQRDIGDEEVKHRQEYAGEQDEHAQRTQRSGRRRQAGCFQAGRRQAGRPRRAQRRHIRGRQWGGLGCFVARPHGNGRWNYLRHGYHPAPCFTLVPGVRLSRYKTHPAINWLDVVGSGRIEEW
ncbi:MAG TPA: hypothetical protein VGH11_04410 [Jatrophihabitans sp.]